MAQDLVRFRFCTVELNRAEAKLHIRFNDGTEAESWPHDTPEYHAHAISKTGTDDILGYCWQHDLMHIIHGEMNGGPSRVLWNLAHNEPLDTPECEAEERAVQQLQLDLQLAHTTTSVSEKVIPYGNYSAPDASARTCSVG